MKRLGYWCWYDILESRVEKQDGKEEERKLGNKSQECVVLRVYRKKICREKHRW